MLFEKYPFKLPELPFAYNALEPYIDGETVHFHYDKHFKVYIDKLNAAIKDYPALHNLTLYELLTNINSLPASLRIPVRNNGGGVFNHSVYFDRLSPEPKPPKDMLKKEIDKAFGSFEGMKTAFNTAANAVFGSGYTFLLRVDGILKIISTPNQDTPLFISDEIIAVADVWEHAYYLKYKNERAKYLENIWNVIDFSLV
ncbi:37s ribosomal protein s26 mitochondrial [Holotrichia oblita]|nr:37s ribosomal protein s26 mitochondrial [Holotrichia oblita]